MPHAQHSRSTFIHHLQGRQHPHPQTQGAKRPFAHSEPNLVVALRRIHHPNLHSWLLNVDFFISCVPSLPRPGLLGDDQNTLKGPAGNDQNMSERPVGNDQNTLQGRAGDNQNTSEALAGNHGNTLEGPAGDDQNTSEAHTDSPEVISLKQKLYKLANCPPFNTDYSTNDLIHL